MASEEKKPKSTSAKNERNRCDRSGCSEKQQKKGSDHVRRRELASIHAARSSRSSTRIKGGHSEKRSSSTRDAITTPAPASSVVKSSKSTKRTSASLIVLEPREPPPVYVYPDRRKETQQTISTVVYSTSESLVAGHGNGPPAPIPPLAQQDRYADAEKARRKKSGAITPEEGALASLAALTCFCCIPWCLPCCCCFI